MSDATLLTGAAFSVVSGLLYAYVGNRVGRRDVSRDDRLALQLFVTWWYALGASSLMGALNIGLYIAGSLTVQTYQALQQLSLLVVLVALWGLLFYLIYLYTGSRKSLIPLSVLYVAFWLYFVYMISGAPPQTITDNGWQLRAEPNPFPESATLVLIAALLGPQMAACVALFRLYFKVTERPQKYRLALVAGAIFAWFASASLAAVAGFGEVLWWQLASRIISVSAALAVLAAYVPPNWVRARYGIQPVS